MEAADAADTPDAATMAAASLGRAMTLMSVRRWRDAQAELAHVLAADPESVPALCLLAGCHLELGEPHAARRAARAAAKIDPTSAWAHRIRSVALLELGDRPKAIRAARQSVQLEPESSDSHVCFAQSLVGIDGLEQEAYDAALRAVELDPASVDARVVLGVASEGHREWATAREAYANALRLDPHDPRSLHLLAGMEVRAGRLRHAVDLLVGALRTDPGDELAQAGLDAVAARLVRRLLIVLVVGGLVLAQMARLDALGDTVAWWHRGVVGVLLLGVVARLGWVPLRRLPASMRPHFQGFAGRLLGRDFVHGLLLVAVVVVVVATTVLPAPIARWVGASLAMVVAGGFFALQLGGMAAITGWGVGEARRQAARRLPSREG